jgi:hypothetical protein
LTAARGAQISRRALFGAGRQAGVRRVEVRDGKIARDGRQLQRRRAGVTAPEPRQALPQVPRRERCRHDEEGASGEERDDGTQERRGGDGARRIDLLRRPGSPDVQEREQLDRCALHRVARELDAAEQF